MAQKLYVGNLPFSTTEDALRPPLTPPSRSSREAAQQQLRFPFQQAWRIVPLYTGVRRTPQERLPWLGSS